MAESNQIPVFEQQKVIIRNRHGEKLVGILHDTGSKEMAILCHGFTSSKDDKTMHNLAIALESEGISAFRFDFSGNGESEGEFEYGNYWKEVEDLRSVFEYFNGLNRVILSVLGHSKGAGVVLLYASKYHDIDTVVNASGRYDLKQGIVERLGEDYMERLKKDGFIDVMNNAGGVSFRVTLESMMDRLNINMHDSCLQIDKSCRVFTVHGSADEVIPVGDAIKFSKILPNHTLHIVEGADHCYNDHQKELTSAVLSFMQSILQKSNQ